MVSVQHGIGVKSIQHATARDLILRSIDALGAFLKMGSVRLILAHKALIIVAVLASVLFFRFNHEEYQQYFVHWPIQSTNVTLATRLAAWNGSQYLLLSEKGYQLGSPSCAFYPLWPAAIHVGAVVTGMNRLAVALVLANLLSASALLLLYHLIREQCNDAIGKATLTLILASPAGLFLCFPYTESLFLFLAVSFFWALKRGRYFTLSVISFLMPLTRAIGVFILLPIAWNLWSRKLISRHWWLLGVPLLGYALYFGILYAYTGSATEGFVAQKYYPNSPSISNIFALGEFWRASIDTGSLLGMTDSILDRGLFLLLLAVLPLLFRLNKLWFWYSFGSGVIPALTNWYMSYRRFTIVCFPLFVACAILLGRSRQYVFGTMLPCALAFKCGP